MPSAHPDETEVTRAVRQTLAAIFPATLSAFDWRLSFPIQRARDAIDQGQSVLLVGGGPEMKLTPDIFPSWLDRLPGGLPVSLAGDWPNAEQAGEGIGWVLRLSPPGREFRYDELPASDPLRAMLGDDGSRPA